MASRAQRLARLGKQGYVAPPFSQCDAKNIPIDDETHENDLQTAKTKPQKFPPSDCSLEPKSSNAAAHYSVENALTKAVALQDRESLLELGNMEPTAPLISQNNPLLDSIENDDDLRTAKPKIQNCQPTDCSLKPTASNTAAHFSVENALTPAVVLQDSESFLELDYMEPIATLTRQNNPLLECSGNDDGLGNISPSMLQDTNEIPIDMDTASINTLIDKVGSVKDDFSPNESGDEYKPEERKRRRLISSSSCSSSSSNSSSSSSSSSSTSNESTRQCNGPNRKDRNTSENNQQIEPNNSNTETNIELTSPIKKGKTKARNPHLWKRNQKKMLKNTGNEYESSSGKTVNAKSMKPPCTDKCRLSCSNKISEESRLQIFKSYWDLGCLQRQRDFLSSCITPLTPACRRIRTDAVRPRKTNCGFYFIKDGKSIHVCKTFLLNTLGIAERSVRTVIDAKVSDVGIIPQDKRGKHGKQAQMDDEIKESVRLHINSISRVESHYLRANTSREFIDGGLTIAQLHRLYKEQRASANKEAATYDTYARIFNTEFNISFFCPKKDQCDLCESYKNADEEGKKKLEQNFQEHLKQKNLSRKEKSDDIRLCTETGSNVVVAIYDLQAVMPVPIGESSAFFYRSKLNCYNFTITDMKSKTTSCYFWHEGLGNRGAIEIGTCVYKFLENLAQNNPNCDVIFYSDNCCGQQKNRFLMAMYYFVVNTLPIKSITHKFLIRGHTQNEGDSAHSIIEKSIKRAKKSGPIYTPDHYVQLIRNAKKTGKPFIVHELNYNDFFDLKALSEEIGLNTATIKLSEVKLIQFTKADFYTYKTRYDEDWTQVDCKIVKGRFSNKRSSILMNQITLKLAYNSKISIAERKKKDLLHLVETNIVPKFYEGFFKSLL